MSYVHMYNHQVVKLKWWAADRYKWVEFILLQSSVYPQWYVKRVLVQGNELCIVLRIPHSGTAVLLLVLEYLYSRLKTTTVLVRDYQYQYRTTGEGAFTVYIQYDICRFLSPFCSVTVVERWNSRRYCSNPTRHATHHRIVCSTVDKLLFTMIPVASFLSSHWKYWSHWSTIWLVIEK